MGTYTLPSTSVDYEYEVPSRDGAEDTLALCYREKVLKMKANNGLIIPTAQEHYLEEVAQFVENRRRQFSILSDKDHTNAPTETQFAAIPQGDPDQDSTASMDRKPPAKKSQAKQGSVENASLGQDHDQQEPDTKASDQASNRKKRIHCEDGEM